MPDIRHGIHPVGASDKAEWRALWDAYCTFYKADVSPAQTDLTWSRILDANHTINSFIARDASGSATGFVTWLTHSSTWLDRGDCYLEDLYVTESARGQGTATALIAAVQQAAEMLGYERLYWMTNIGNTRARSLYDSIAGGEDGHVRYRMRLR